MQVGDKVKHKERPEFGIGEIVGLIGEDLFIVEFTEGKFSGVSSNAFVVVKSSSGIETQAVQKAVNSSRVLVRSEGSRPQGSLQIGISEAVSRNVKDGRLRESNGAGIESIEAAFSSFSVRSLWHITHRDNVGGILQRGILSHSIAHRYSANRVDISDPDAQKWRERFEPCYGRKIHEYAPLSIKARNPMLYLRRDRQSELCLIEVGIDSLVDVDYLITDGNAASRDTLFFRSCRDLDKLPWDVLNGQYWADREDGKRKMCAEVLVWPRVDRDFIKQVHCLSKDTENYLSKINCRSRISPELFF